MIDRRLRWLALLSLALAFTLRGWEALRTEAPLNVDEQYYLSMAANSAYGYGLYPTTIGLDELNLYPGNGYGVLLYTAAYRLLGESVVSLRIVSLVALALALPATFGAVRLLYGVRTAWTALMIFGWLSFVWLSNSARFDTVTIAYVAWMLYGVLYALDRGKGWRWHLALGVAMGFGLQIHLNTTITAFALGLVYLWRHIESARAGGGWVRFNAPVLLFVGGYMVGAVCFVVFNILPDRDQFFVVLEVLREWETAVYNPQFVGRDLPLPASLFDLPAMASLERGRYTLLLRLTPLFEVGLAALGLVALAVRRTDSDRLTALMVGGVVVCSAVILINGTFMYLIHQTPILILPAVALLTYGFGRTERGLSLVMGAVVVLAVMAGQADLIRRAVGLEAMPEEPAAPRYLDDVRLVADRHDVLAGRAEEFVQHFAGYPRYFAINATQEELGVLLTGADDPAAYWSNVAPHYVFGFNDFDAIRDYVLAADYVNISIGLWARADRGFAPPDFDNPSGDFGDVVRLLGVSTPQTTVRACDRLPVVSHWQTIADDVPDGLSVGLHLHDANGDLIAQADGAAADFPFDQWALFQFLPDLREIAIPCDAPTGEYELRALVYDFRDGSRLPVDDGGDALAVMALTVGGG